MIDNFVLAVAVETDTDDRREVTTLVPQTNDVQSSPHDTFLQSTHSTPIPRWRFIARALAKVQHPGADQNHRTKK